MNARFWRLVQPFRLGSLELRNRIVMPPMVTSYGSEDGLVTEQLKGYYAARSRGGVGLVIVEAACIDAPAGKIIKRQLQIDDDRFVPGLTEHLELTPDLQYVKDPSLNPGVSSLWYFGLRSRFTL